MSGQQKLAAWQPARAPATVAAACRGRASSQGITTAPTRLAGQPAIPLLGLAVHLPMQRWLRGCFFMAASWRSWLRAPLVCEAKLAQLTLRVQLLSPSGEL